MKNIISHIQANTNLSEQEAWWMLQHITKQSKEQLILQSSDQLSLTEKSIINEWINKLNQEATPLAYLIGFVPFLNLTVQVEPPILIPRPETEEWVAHIIQTLQPYKQNIKTILDIGTGSGCIGIALAKEFKDSHVIATDINPQALKLAQQNAINHGITNISFIQSNLFENLQNKTFDLIVSNPPYIDPIHTDTIIPQVKKWEDHKALFAQNKGLSIIEQLLEQSSNFFTKNNNLPFNLVFEFDHGQQDIIKNKATVHAYNCSIQKDLFQKYRVALCKYNS